MTLAFDADLSARIEATYRTPDVVAQRRTILDVLDPRPGENALDIGSGPGLLAAQIAERVHPSGSVHGLDPSESMLALSAERAATAGVALAAGLATELPYVDSAFDIVTATQVYEYVPDMPTALAEARRVLRPGGRLLVLDTDWDSVVWHSSNSERMRRAARVERAPRRRALTAPAEPAAHRGRVHRRPLRGCPTPQRAATPPADLQRRADRFHRRVRTRPRRPDGRRRRGLARGPRTLGLDYFCSVNRYLFLAVAA